MKFKHTLINEENNTKIVFETYANCYTQIPYVRKHKYYLHSNVHISTENVVAMDDAIDESKQLKRSGYKEE